MVQVQKHVPRFKISYRKLGVPLSRIQKLVDQHSSGKFCASSFLSLWLNAMQSLKWLSEDTTDALSLWPVQMWDCPENVTCSEWVPNNCIASWTCAVNDCCGRSLFQLYPQLLSKFPFSKDEWSRISLVDYQGYHAEHPANTWFVVFRWENCLASVYSRVVNL